MSQDNHLIIEKDGYPLQIEGIQTLNDATQQALTNIAAVCGSNTILKGCADEVREGVTYVTDGIMCIGGKIYQFRGGKKTGGVTIITDKVSDIYDTGDGSAKQMLPVRGFSYVTSSPEGASNIAWSSFVRVSDLKTINEELQTFKQGLNDIQTDVKELQDNRILKKGIRDADLTGTSDWTWFNVFMPDNNEYDYTISANIVIYKDDINEIKSQYSLTVYNKYKGGFSLFVKRVSGPGDKISVDYLAVKHKKSIID
ncbi:hypothetical protein [Myroides odoratimimus]|uniref:hypothetical protein n=1 Tax=Myroides odoratimimus TaxID=76832 RepID=UPI0025771C76|nr:hypothetical protein [Myroides odoratimimus]MDM1513603.1 hypothetical protein [Myroides odoratimimus]